jgi:formylglycine-generating enzyme required for sulfatase activity
MRTILFVVLLISALTQSARAEDNSGHLPKDAPSPLTAPFDARKAKTAQEAWAKSLGKLSPVEKNSIGMDLVLIPPGKFTMGSAASEKDRWDGEAQVDVTLTKSFYLGKTEVTQRQWRSVMGTTPWKGLKGAREGETDAVTYVSWDDAQAFCKKLGEKEQAAYRLPTEAEWEYACRGGTTTQYCFGDDESQLGEHAWYQKNASDIGELYAHEVGRKQPNPFGLYDMHGNAWEFCEDLYVEKLPGGTDPLVSTGGDLRVFRGGGWYDLAANCRSAVLRNRLIPSTQSSRLGFRVARNSGD